MHNKIKASEHKQRKSAEMSIKKEKRAYTAPAIGSAEALEAVAVVCSPSIPGGPGKTIQAFGCATLGS
jgi:hypothetical protein